MFNRQNNLDFEGWFRTKVIGPSFFAMQSRIRNLKDKCPRDKIIWTLRDGSEQKT